MKSKLDFFQNILRFRDISGTSLLNTSKTSLYFY